MNRSFKLSALILLMAAVCGIELATGSAAQEPPAEQVYQNVQVFKGLPATQLYPAMNYIAAALGVNCTHCHVQNEFAKDDKPAKQTARRMIQMTQAINQGTFNGALTVTCHTCHRGQPKPVAVPALALNAIPEHTSASPPTVEQLLDSHVAALGGRAKLEKITTLAMKGTETASRVDGQSPARAVEIYRQSPNRLLIVNPQPRGDSLRAFDGERGWQQFGERVMGMSANDLGMIRREARFDRNFNFREQYRKMTVAGKAKLGEREAWVIEAAPTEGRLGPMTYEVEKLYFDARAGLLIRRYLEPKTALGSAPMATDYDDYREVDGVKWPFTISTLFPGFNLTQRFTEIKANAPLEEEKFKRPASKQ